MHKNPQIGRRFFVLSLVGSAGALALSVAGRRRASDDDIIRSSVHSSVSLRRIARVPFTSDRPDGHSVLSLAWNPDGRRLAASFDWGFQVAVFDTSTWKELARFKGKSFQPSRALEFVSNSEIVTAPAENHRDSSWALGFYDSETGQLVREIPRPQSFKTAISEAIVVTASKKYVALLAGGLPVVLLFDAAKGQFIDRLSTPLDSWTPVIAAGPHDKLAVNVSFLGAASAQPEVRKGIYIFDASTNKVDRILAGHVPGVGSLAWSPDGRLIASGAPMLTGKKEWVRDLDPIRIWDVETGKMIMSFVGFYDPISQLVWHPSSEFFATRSAVEKDQSGSAIRFWSISRREMIFEYLVADRGTVTALSFQPQTGHFVWGQDGAFHVFEVLGL